MKLNQTEHDASLIYHILISVRDNMTKVLIEDEHQTLLNGVVKNHRDSTGKINSTSTKHRTPATIWEQIALIESQLIMMP